MSSLEENKSIVRRFVEASNARDYEVLEAVVSPDFVRHCLARLRTSSYGVGTTFGSSW